MLIFFSAYNFVFLYNFLRYGFSGKVCFFQFCFSGLFLCCCVWFRNFQLEAFSVKFLRKIYRCCFLRQDLWLQTIRVEWGQLTSLIETYYECLSWKSDCTVFLAKFLAKCCVHHILHLISSLHKIHKYINFALT